jgi:hypothetical protein
MICKAIINEQEKEFDLDLNVGGHIYSGNDYIATDGKYVVIGVHNCNPGCYKYLEMIVVYDITKDKYRLIKVWDVIGNACHSESDKLLSVKYDGNNFIIRSGLKSAYVFPENIMAEDMKPGTIVKPTLDLTKMETCFDYEVMDDMSVLMTLKEDVPMKQFLKWTGFSMDYDAFKFWGEITHGGQSYLMFINMKTEKTWTVSYGHSTTAVGGYVWQQRDALLECMKKVLTNHPKFREYSYTQVL